MKKPIGTYDPFDVVVVPFPFSDRDASKRRPALVLSSSRAFNAPSGHAVLAMITSQENRPWPLDVPLRSIASAGLSVASVVRMRLFTLDLQLVVRKAGKLASEDSVAVIRALEKLIPRP